MVSIGNTILPGVSAEIESAANTSVNIGAAAQVGIVGQADLSAGTASANTVYEVTRPVQARDLFGEGSLLADAAVDALSEGAYPVYAVATTESAATDDISGMSGSSTTLANAPIIEDMSSVTVTVDGSTLTPIRTFEDPANKSPASDEAYVNPVTGKIEVGSSPGDGDNTNDTVDYTHYDYDSASDALRNGAGSRVDFFGVLTENEAAKTYAHDLVNQMVNDYNFAIVAAGAEPHIPDTSSYTPGFDSSRMVELYPTRLSDGSSILGRYLGLRATLGINNSPIFSRLNNGTRFPVKRRLDQADRENLVEANVTPLADGERGAKVVDDLTTVTDSNSEEANMRQAMHRLIVDYVTSVVHDKSQQFIGRLHKKSSRNSLESVITSNMNELMNQDAITAFTINVEKVDAMTASLDVGVDMIDPLRNIKATVTAGQVN